MSTSSPEREWLMLLHQLPPDPPALRVRVWRRLQAIGALQLKSTVYLLPFNDEAQEDFAWLAREIRAAGAEVTVWRSRIVGGLSDADIIARFQTQVQADYELLEGEVKAAAEQISASEGTAAEGKRLLSRLRNRFGEIERRDFFNAARREVVGALLDQLTSAFHRAGKEEPMESTDQREMTAQYQGRTWITRANVKVDRMASAWLIRRFIDSEATFRFIHSSDHAERGALRFDMYEGEFTHEGDHCTFETLINKFQLDEPGLIYLSHIIHDIDLKDDRYQHPETASLAAALSGISAGLEGDPVRIEVASGVFDRLLDQFASK